MTPTILSDPNIVKLFQVIDTEEPLFLIMEHVSRPRMRPGVSSGSWYPLCSTTILFGAQINITIADFGLSNKFTVHKLNMFCGSPLYATPELFLGQNCRGPAVTVEPGSRPALCGHWEDCWKLQQQILGRQYHVPFFMSFEKKNW